VAAPPERLEGPVIDNELEDLATDDTDEESSDHDTDPDIRGPDDTLREPLKVRRSP
jgi:hypothetical protein